MNKEKGFFKRLGDIFLPLLPGFIIAGLCAGFASLLAQLVPDYKEIPFVYAVHTVLSLINTAFTGFLSAWVGFSAAKAYGGTAILGGVLGMVGSLDGIDTLSSLIGFFNPANPASSILRAGSGGVMTVIFGAWLLSRLEAFFHKRFSKGLDPVLTPFCAFLICLVPYLFVLMPLLGFVSSALCKGLEFLTMNSSFAVRLISGYVCAALFLPASLFGLHFGFIALYAIQLEASGCISLYPILAMAGASQVGSAIAVLFKARRNHNDALRTICASGIPPGMLGIGSALLYGVCIPYSKVFLTTCLGAGFGGAFIVATGVCSTGWGPSGLLALPLMTAGSGNPLGNMLHYLTGLCLACLSGFLLSSVFVKQTDLAQE